MFKITQHGFSLLETFLAALLFVFSTAAVFTSIYSIRKPAVNTDQMSQGALAGKQVLEALRYYVNPNGYSSGGYLYPGGPYTLPSSVVSLPAGYTVSYVVSTDPPGCVENAPTTFCGRQVIATVTWTDAM